ncbi:MAG TPA: hypothetical protein VLV88_05015 [Terriglobales bacterium]|nr:hypothetical protein [Terriglobales bacterium]
MAHIYLTFDFGTDEEKAQQARHRLEGWKQAFRLDKKLTYKFDRSDGADAEAHPEEEKKKESAKKGKAKSAKGNKLEEAAAEAEKIKLLIRLAFSSHEKLTEQRWVDRIPTEEPFKEAAPEAVREGQPAFEDVEARFEVLD